jgi:hypothetical protein
MDRSNAIFQPQKKNCIAFARLLLGSFGLVIPVAFNWVVSRIVLDYLGL